MMLDELKHLQREWFASHLLTASSFFLTEAGRRARDITNWHIVENAFHNQISGFTKYVG